MNRRLLLTIVWVLAIVVPAFAVDDPVTGTPRFGSFSSTNFDLVNRENLNFHFEVPIVSLPGRGTTFNHSVVYDSSIWKPVQTGPTSAWSPVTDGDGTAFWGWEVDKVQGFVKHYQDTFLCGQTTYVTGHEYRYVDPNGTSHDFEVTVYTARPKKPLVICDADDPTCMCDMNRYQSTPRIGNAMDGSGFQVDATNLDAPVVIGPDGYRIGTAVTPDRNGNFIAYNVVDATTTDWIDTVGRRALRIEKRANSSIPNRVVDFSVLDNDGTAQHYVVTYECKDIKTAFGCSGVNEYTKSGVFLPTSLALPNGRSYTFAYEATPGDGSKTTGRLARINLPTGGYIQYEFTADGVQNYGIDCATGTTRYLKRTISDAGSTEVKSTWVFERTVTPTTKTTTETQPLLPGDSAPNHIVFTSSDQTTKLEIYQGDISSANLKRSITQMFVERGPYLTLTRYEDQTPVMEAQIGTTYDANGNLTELTEYPLAPAGQNFPAPIRCSHYTFVSSQPYASRHMVNLPETSIVKECGVNGSVKSRVDFSYDATANYICDASAATAGQHDNTNYGCNFYTRGNLTSVTTYLDPIARTGAKTQNLFYDQLGNLRKATADCCQLKRWDYSAATQWALPDSVTSGPASGNPNLTTSQTYFPRTGLVASSTDENLQTTTFAYDQLNRLLTITRPNNGGQLVYSYSEPTTDSGGSVTVSAPIDGNRRQKSKTKFDKLGRPTQTVLMDANDNLYSTQDQEYDSLSRVYRVRNPFQGPNGAPDLWTTTLYDALGRPAFIIPPDGTLAANRTRYFYSGLDTTIEDPSGRQRKSQYDALGRLVTVFEPDPANGNALTQRTDYTFDFADRLIQVNQGSQVRAFVYNALGRLTSQTTPEAGTVQFSYTDSGQINQRIDARGVRTNYFYDDLKRLVRTEYDLTNASPGVQPTAPMDFVYGTDAAQNNKGRLVSMTDGSGSETYTYNNQGQISQLQKVIAGRTYSLSFAYNLAGQVTSITYPSGRQVNQAFDAIGRLSAVSGSGTTYASEISYGPGGQVLGWNYGNGIAAILGYSPARQQLSSLQYNKPGQGSLFSLSYSYSNNGLISQIQDNVHPGRTATYGYDPLNRLTSASTAGSTIDPQWGLSWSFDRFGNRLTQTATSGTPPTINTPVDGNNRQSSPGFSYDLAGNLIAAPGLTLAYDAEGRQVQSNAGSVRSFVYDGRDLRVQRTEGTLTVDTIWSGEVPLVEYDHSGTAPLREYVYQQKQLLAIWEGTNIRFIHADHLSTRMVTDSGGNVVDEQGHYPYGESWYSQGESVQPQFTNYWRGSGEDLDYANVRHYFYRHGMFSSADPVFGSAVDPQSLNRYTYARNNPISLVDPSGRTFMLPFMFDPYFFLLLGPIAEVTVTGKSPTSPYIPSENPFPENPVQDVAKPDGDKKGGGSAGSPSSGAVPQCDPSSSSGSTVDDLVGATAGQSALDYYGSIITDPNSSSLGKAGAYVGGFFSALWTPSTWKATAVTLGGAWSVSSVLSEAGMATQIRLGLHNHVGGPHAFPHMQINTWMKGVKGSGSVWRFPCGR